VIDPETVTSRYFIGRLVEKDIKENKDKRPSHVNQLVAVFDKVASSTQPGKNIHQSCNVLRVVFSKPALTQFILSNDPNKAKKGLSLADKAAHLAFECKDNELEHMIVDH
jgi:hypothetical protein